MTMTGMRRAAQARRQQVVARAQAKQTCIEQAISSAPTASETVETASPAPVHLSPYDQALVDKWVSDRLTAEVPGLCWHCRRSFVAGQQFVDVRGAEVVVRFHAQCKNGWRARQEELARGALGLPAIPTEETMS